MASGQAGPATSVTKHVKQHVCVWDAHECKTSKVHKATYLGKIIAPKGIWQMVKKELGAAIYATKHFGLSMRENAQVCKTSMLFSLYMHICIWPCVFVFVFGLQRLV